MPSSYFIWSNGVTFVLVLFGEPVHHPAACSISYVSGDPLKVAAAENGGSGVQERKASRSGSDDLSSPRDGLPI